MKKKSFFRVTVACLAILFCVSISFKTPTNSINNTNQIIGVWKCISPLVSGEGGREIIKIITKNRFILWHTFNGEMVMSLGGYYTFDGEVYTENVTLGSPNQKATFGRKCISKVRFEGNEMYTTGGYENDPRVFNEIWERVE